MGVTAHFNRSVLNIYTIGRQHDRYQGDIFSCDEDKPAELVTVDQSDYRNIQKYTSGPFGAFDAFRPSCSIFYSDEGRFTTCR